MRRGWMLVAVVFLLSQAAWAQGTEEKLGLLEKEVADLKAKMGGGGEGKPTVTSKWEVKFYGMVKFEMGYDSHLPVSTINYRYMSTPPNTANANDDAFDMNLYGTRLGFDFVCPEFAGAKPSAKIEADFNGAGGGAITPNFRLRHAYMDLNYKDYGLNFRVGQTYDIIAPLSPDVLGFDNQLYYGGNLGNVRKPQVAVKKTEDLTDWMTFTAEAAMVRGFDNENIGTTTNDDAVVSHKPAWEGRVALGFAPLGMEKKIEVGVSGHFGYEDAEIAYAAGNREGNHTFETYSMSLDLLVPVCEMFDLKGEAWRGRNLDGYDGGINQGVAGTTTNYRHEIDSRGGWGQARIHPMKDLHFAAGLGIDDPKNHQLAQGARSRNFVKFANVVYDVNKAISVGLEGQEIWTDFYNYANTDLQRGEDHRLMMSATFKF